MKRHIPKPILLTQFDAVDLATPSLPFVISGLELKHGSLEYQGRLKVALVQRKFVMRRSPDVPQKQTLHTAREVTSSSRRSVRGIGKLGVKRAAMQIGLRPFHSQTRPERPFALNTPCTGGCWLKRWQEREEENISKAFLSLSTCMSVKGCQSMDAGRGAPRTNVKDSDC